MALYGGKLGGTRTGWSIPEQREQTLPTTEQARGLLESMCNTGQAADVSGHFLSGDGKIGGGPVEALRVESTEGYSAVSGAGRAIRVDWADADEYEHSFYIADIEWKGRVQLEAIVRKVLKDIARKRGRPTIAKDGGAQNRRQISLDDAHIEKAKAIGGNVSAGIRIALDAYHAEQEID